MNNNFGDLASFMGTGIFSYLDPEPNSPDMSRLLAIAKRYPQHFRVLERIPGSDRYLTILQSSDYAVATLAEKRGPDSVVVATLVKERLTTWAAVDWLSNMLTQKLGRKIWPEQIRHSGLKDRWAETAQSIAIVGVTVDELRRIQWPYNQGKTGFFLKDIRWHDARKRLHTVADERRNRAGMEVTANVTDAGYKAMGISARSLAMAIADHLSKEFGRKVDANIKERKEAAVQIFIWGVTVSELMAAKLPAGLAKFENIRINRTNTISKGDHKNNRFELKIIVKDHDKTTVENYLAPRIEVLQRRGNYIPNAYNLQRLAARQKGHLDGYTLITGDYPAPKGVHAFASASEAAIYRFLFETTGRENPAAEQLRRDIEKCWLYDFGGMKQKLEKSYRQLNLSVEFKIAERLIDNDRYPGFEAVVESMSEECSLWIAAWQSYWWNQVLARKLPHWVKLMDESGGDFNPADKGIPLLMETAESRRYYERLPYCKDALAHLKKADPFVRKEFLTPRGNNPWRKAFIKVDGLAYSVETEMVDGVEQTVVNTQFNLSSGAYATTLLGFLFELEEPNKGSVRALANAAEVSEAPDLNEETE